MLEVRTVGIEQRPQPVGACSDRTDDKGKIRTHSTIDSERSWLVPVTSNDDCTRLMRIDKDPEVDERGGQREPD